MAVSESANYLNGSICLGVRTVESQTQETEFSRLVKATLLAIGFATAAYWVRGNYQYSEEMQLLSLVLYVFAAFAFLGATVSLLTISASQVLLGTQHLSEKLFRLLRFYVFQKGFAIVGACSILVLGFILVTYLSPNPIAYFLILTVSFITAVFPDAHARIVESNWYYRMFRSGTTPDSEFAQAYHLRKYAKPFEDMFVEGYGYCADTLFIGSSTREASVKPLDIWDSSSVSEIVFATTGAGKFVTDIAPRICTYMGSGIYSTIKPEFADFGTGVNVDVSTSFARELREAGLDPGVDPRKWTTVATPKPRFRTMVLDPLHQSVAAANGQDCSYSFFVDIPRNNPSVAIPRAQALALALIEEKGSTNSDPFFEKAPRALVLSAIGYVANRFPPELQNLPAMADFLMGKNPRTGGACEKQFRKNLEAMAACGDWSGLIASGAARMLQAGAKSFGSINYEVGNALSFCQEPAMRKHLAGQSRFSYEEVGDDKFPLSIFIIPDRVATKASAGFMRCHAAMSLAVFKTRLQRPNIPIIYIGDEFRQYGKGIGLAEASLVLRDNRVKLCLYFHDVASAILTLGEHEFEEFMATSSKRFYGVGTYGTAELISKILGNRWLDDREIPLADPQTIMRELSVRTDLQYVLPYAGPPVMRLHRRGFKTIKTSDGATYRGLPLEGLYDEQVSRFKN